MDFVIAETGEHVRVSYMVRGMEQADEMILSSGYVPDDEVMLDDGTRAYVASKDDVDYWVEYFEILSFCDEEIRCMKKIYLGCEEDGTPLVDSVLQEEMGGGSFDIDDYKSSVESTKSILQKRFNTETARLISSYDSKLLYSDFCYFREDLYQQDDGSYFFKGEGGPMSQYGREQEDGSIGYGDGYYPATEEEVQEWFHEHFGEKTDERWDEW